MLNLNCVLADITNKIRIASKYGTCDEKWFELQGYLSSYQWIFNNAWDCLTSCQQQDIATFLRSNFNGYSYTMCEDVTETCAATPAPLNDNCSGAISMGYPIASRPTSNVPDLTNTYTCGVVDYPLDSGVALPSSWAVDSSGDIWYSFNTGTSGILSPYITIQGGTIQYPQIAVYSGACGGLSFVAEAENGTSLSNYMQVTLAAGTSYYLRVSNSGGNPNTGTFSLTISLFPII